ncbi:MAG: hypothetical protein AAF639_31790 [Chloroflexota bacterium]
MFYKRCCLVTHELDSSQTPDIYTEELAVGKHILYIQGKQQDGTQTDLVVYPFTIVE